MLGRDFRSETIYFILTDRFNNGDPDNDLGKNPELSDPTHKDWLKYWGGDLQGIRDKLDYLQRLGITALWISPVFDQVDDLAVTLSGSAPYHGYWTKDFKRIDEHLLPRSEWDKPFSDRSTVFDSLVREAHERGLKVFLDVVCNHTHAGGPNTPKGALYDDGRLLTSYDNDVLGWYNRHGPIRDWQSVHELTKGELKGGLADLNEDVWSFRRYIIDTMAAWLDRGVDGFRLDTVKHMSLSFWQEFTATMFKHKPDAVLFGEWAGLGHWDRLGLHFASQSGMSVLDFSFQYVVKDVLCDGRPFHHLAQLFHHDHVYDDATTLVTFLDNHDMPRLLSCGLDPDLLPLAVVLLMTARGVPCIYYGTEQYLHNDTEGGGDPYNRPMMERWSLDTSVAQLLPILSQLRARSSAIQRGFTNDLFVTDTVYAYERVHGDSAVLVAVNRGPATGVDLTGVHLPDGSYADVLSAGPQSVEVVGRRIQGLPLPEKSAVVLEHTVPFPANRSRIVARLNGFHTRHGQQIAVVGDVPELGDLDPARAVPLYYVNANQWTGDLMFNESAGKDVLYRYVVLGADGTVQYEDRLPRMRRAPPEGVSQWRDRWEQ